VIGEGQPIAEDRLDITLGCGNPHASRSGVLGFESMIGRGLLYLPCIENILRRRVARTHRENVNCIGVPVGLVNVSPLTVTSLTTLQIKGLRSACMSLPCVGV
jgi:hypothetical protein